MSSADSESWARLRLVQGESAAQVWELVASAGQTTLTVGLSPGCHWVVREEGVAPIHFSLHWDGATLRIADTYGAGNVRVDGGLIGPQWKPLSGRVRIDFGKAAIVVEASGPSRSDAPHPLEPSAGKSSSPPKNMKSTLIGVSPLTGSAPAPASSVSSKTAVELPASEPPPSDSFRPKRPADSQRSPKPTLVGMAAMPKLSSQPPVEPREVSGPSGATSRPPGSSPAPAPSEPAKSGAAAPPRSGGVSTGTLMGFNMHDNPLSGRPGSPHPGGQRVSGGSLADADQRTIQGFPSVGSAQSAPPQAGPIGRRVTQQGVVSEAPGVTPGAVARAPVRTISSQPPSQPAPGSQPPSRPPSGRPAPDPHGKVWHEVPPELDTTPSVPQAVLTGRPSSSAPPPGHHGETPTPRMSSSQPPPLSSQPPPPGYHGGGPTPPGRSSHPPRSPQPPPPGRGRQRFSDAPAAPREAAALEPRPQKSSFPWAYVGIAALTAMAYLAWLYLLDHL